jgi:hypothetical protein
MRIKALSVALGLVVVIGTSTGCSSASRKLRKPAVAVLVSSGPGVRPSPTDVAEVLKWMQPEIEKRGYVMAKSSRSADYFVDVRIPFDPLSLGRLTFIRGEPTVPFLKDDERQPDQGNRDYKRAIAEMVREPK